MLGEREAMASMILALASLWKSIENYRLSQGGKKKEVFTAPGLLMEAVTASCVIT